MCQDINVPFAEGPRKMMNRWSLDSAVSVTEIMNIAEIIFIPTSILNDRKGTLKCLSRI